jgi:hypothetical protein
MVSRRIQFAAGFLGRIALLVVSWSAFASASATLLLEEPYGKLGFFTPTGHAAVYLTGVCAESPLILRRCAPGEAGVVISRYNGVGGYDWVAIPLIPYLYAVDHAEEVPLFADAKMTAFLRDRYRREYLEDISPDAKDGSTPGGNWYQLVGSSYDRTTYGFEIETTPEQDQALIRKLNSSQNESHFHTVSRNCADFAKDVLNFYYPRALHRSVIADVGITTPKQMAKMLIKYSQRHPDLQFSRIVIPQVPGSMPRSNNVRGVVEAFFRSKKYIVPSAVVSPIFAGCVAAVFVTTGGAHRFEPGRDATVFVVGGDPEKPLDREDVRAYQQQLKHLLAGAYPEKTGLSMDKSWERLQAGAARAVDSKGRPVLQIPVGDHLVQLGASAGNIWNGQPPSQLVRQLLEARLESELGGRSSHSITEAEVSRDWQMLQRTMAVDSPLTAHVIQRSEAYRGNQP